MTKVEDTYMIATNSGDQTFLQFIHDRLKIKHGENELYDYMWKLREYITFFKEYGQDIARLIRLLKRQRARQKKGLLIMVDFKTVEDPTELERLELDEADKIIFGYTVDQSIGTNFMGDIDQLDIRWINDYTYVRPVDHEATPNPDDPTAGCYALEGYISAEDVLKHWRQDQNFNEAKFKKQNPGHRLPTEPATPAEDTTDEQTTAATTEPQPVDAVDSVTSVPQPEAKPATGSTKKAGSSKKA